jgi:hypothetical protein
MRCLATLVVGAAVLFGATGCPTQPSSAVLLPKGATAILSFNTGPGYDSVELAALSDDGSTVVWTTTNRFGTGYHMTDLRTSPATSTDVAYAGPETSTVGVAVGADASPNGRFVAFTSRDPKLQPGVTDLNCTSHVIPEFFGHPYEEPRLCREIYLYDRDTGVTVQVTGVGSPSAADNAKPRFIDDRYLSYTGVLDGQPTRFRWDRETGTTDVLVGDVPGLGAVSLDGHVKWDTDTTGNVIATDLTTNVTDTVIAGTPGVFIEIEDVTTDGRAALVYNVSAYPEYMALVDRTTHEQRVLPTSAWGDALINGDGTMMVNIKPGAAFTPSLMYRMPI